MGNINSVSAYTKTFKSTGTVNKKIDSSENKTSNIKEDTVSISKKSDISESERTETINRLIAQNEERLNAFKSLIHDMITKQGEKSNLKLFNLDLTVTEEQSMEAAKAIAEDGDWGVDAVASRIMSMAESFIGTDSSLFSTIKNAVLEGYADAEKKWGGELPQICKDTLSEINNRFDKLEEKLFGISDE